MIMLHKNPIKVISLLLVLVFSFICIQGSTYSNPKNTDQISDSLMKVQIFDADVETGRFIIKYKNGEASGSMKRALQGKEVNIRSLKTTKNKNVDVVVFDTKKKLADFVNELKSENSYDYIEYIQPDYQLNLLSDDPYYANQWGLENTAGEMSSPDDYPYEMIPDMGLDMLPPYLRELVDSSPELRELLMNASPEEIRDRLLTVDNMPGDIPREVLEELIHDLMFRHIMESRDARPVWEEYLCDAEVPEAWEKSTGSGVVVAVIDTEVDIYHEDIAENIWVNSGEVSGNDMNDIQNRITKEYTNSVSEVVCGGSKSYDSLIIGAIPLTKENGIDDDGNGYIDDLYGWNFCEDNNTVSGSVYGEDISHGTHIAGIIAAVKDNWKGSAGVAPSARVMPLKVFNEGTAYTSDIIEAIEYAEKMGAKIVNCSWGSTVKNPALEEAIKNSNMLFVCAAGNSGTNIDNNPVYPASLDHPNVISVASVNRNGILSGFSNYGQNSVHVAAPGEEILSTLPGNDYGYMNGTSMSTAFVSGEAALLLSVSEDISPGELKERIINCSDRLPSLTGRVFESRKINCWKAVNNENGGDMIEVPGNGDMPENSPAGQDGDGFSLFSTVEGQFIAVACGNYHSIALRSDGTVWACGNNNYGQLGNGTRTDSLTPVQVSGLSDITAIACGGWHSIALKEDGTVWAWGYSFYGQLGIGEVLYLYPKWSFGYPYVPDTYSYIADCTEGISFNFAIMAYNKTGFSGRTYTVIYDNEDIDEVVDLCAMTPQKELTTGIISGTGITIIQNDPGIIKFTIDKDIPSGKSWSGIVNIITFKPSITGQTTLNCEIE